jgi:hypothetical protein
MRGVYFHHVISGSDTKGWVHSHGMDRHRLPELEMRNVPAFLAEAAADILREVCRYMIESGKKVSVGETMAVSPQTAFRFVKADPIPGQENHYERDRWRIIEVECQCEECGKSEGSKP